MVALIISVASAQAQKSQVIAHRGYWKTAGSAQNSITALQTCPAWNSIWKPVKNAIPNLYWN